jgi:hypothetical protein
MKNLLKPFLLFLLPACLAIGCEKENPDYPLTFEFYLQGESGINSIVFMEDENFVFNLSILNHSDDTLFFRPQSFNFKDFLRVDKIVDGEEGKEKIDQGKPYRACAEIGSISIPPGKTTFVMPWKAAKDYIGALSCYGNDQNLLEKGNYHTSFTSSFTFKLRDQTFTTSPRHFEIFFEIE